MPDLHVPVIVTDGGPWAEHDMACAVCQERKAVLDLGTGRFEPCWSCQAEGWALRRSHRRRPGPDPAKEEPSLPLWAALLVWLAVLVAVVAGSAFILWTGVLG